MRRAWLACAVALAAGCQSIDCSIGKVAEQPGATSAATAAGTQPGNPTELSTPAYPIRTSGTSFVDASGRPFEWRGITAFRLAEMVANGREPDATAYLDWTKSEHLTVVRVLLMAQHLFKLTPEAGRGALPRLLDLAKARGIAVEVVALADTKDAVLDYEAHIREVGRIALERGNALVEIANEPGHPTQDPKLHDPAFARRLAALLPDPLAVALGSVEYGEGFGNGEYVTTHLPRGQKDWDHVLAVKDGARLLSQFRKPVISDEPIGAGPEYQPGRRDNEPSRFAAAAALTRFVGMSGTFHYEAGLQAKIPRGREAACLAAWQMGLALVKDVPHDGELLEGRQLAEIIQTPPARAAFGRVTADRAVVLLIDPRPQASLTLATGWKEARRSGVPGVQILFLERSSP